MKWIQRRIVIMCLLAVTLSAAAPAPAAAMTSERGFNDEYVFATTRAVNNMDANPALKLTLFPATIVLDTAFLPFAVIAGFVT